MSEDWLEVQCEALASVPDRGESARPARPIDREAPGTEELSLASFAAGRVRSPDAEGSLKPGTGPELARIPAERSTLRPRTVAHPTSRNLGAQTSARGKLTGLRGLPTARLEDTGAVCDKLAAVATLKPLVDSCPTQSSLRTALNDGLAERGPGCARVFQGRCFDGEGQARLRGGTRRPRGVHRSSGWRSKCGENIASGSSNEARIRPLLAAIPGMSAYMAFRKLAGQLEPSVVRAFALLAAERKSIEAIPEDVRSAEVGRSIRFAYARRRQVLLEGEEPALRGLMASDSESYCQGPGGTAVYRGSSLESSVTARSPPASAPAVLAGDVRGVERVLQDFESRVARARSERRSLDSLASLRDWMKDQWISESGTEGSVAATRMRKRCRI